MISATTKTMMNTDATTKKEVATRSMSAPFVSTIFDEDEGSDHGDDDQA
jgi:hypothetical protein